MARTRKKALWIASEGASYDTNPAGGSYFYLPATAIEFPKDEQELLETNYFTGRNWETAYEVGSDSWAVSFELPLCGMASNSGTGAPGADDGYDVLLTHIFGTQTNVTGYGITSSTSSTVTWDSGGALVSDLYPIFDSGITVTGGQRTQWAFFTSSGTALAPNFVTNPTGTGVAHQHKNYRFDDDGGNSVSFVVRQDDTDYALSGGCVRSASIMAENGKIVKLKVGFAGTSKVDGAAGAVISGLPAVSAFSRFMKQVLSPVFFNGSAIATRSIEVDLGIISAPLESTAAAARRADYELIGQKPTVTIEPLFTTAQNAFKANGTRGRLLAQFGAGVYASSILNTCAIHADEAQAHEIDPVDENGRVRQRIKFVCSDPVTNAGGAAIPFQLSRG